MEELDPEIEALLNSVEPLEELPSDDENKGFKKKVFLDYSENELISSKKKSIHEVDLSQKEFEPITELLYQTPLTVFDDTKYYKTALTGENEYAQRVHQLLSKYLTTKDPKDRALFRQQLVTPFWELLRGMVSKMTDPNVPLPKKMFVLVFCFRHCLEWKQKIFFQESLLKIDLRNQFCMLMNGLKRLLPVECQILQLMKKSRLELQV